LVVNLNLTKSVVKDVIENVHEKGLEDLIAEIAKLCNRNALESKKLAVEKIRDVFERLKTA